MKKGKKNYAIIVLVVILLALAIGYAAFQATLTVNGTATGSMGWDVHFASATLKDSTGAKDTTHGTATVVNPSIDGKTVTATVELKYPGDGVILETVIQNDGTVPAKLTKFEPTGADSDLIITPAGPTVGETIAANGGTCTSQFMVKWNPESNVDNLGTKTFKITFEYEQGTTEFNATPTHNDAQ